ncbi:hypothetical protein MRX96_023396 [Rhipicephalus microplus]
MQALIIADIVHYFNWTYVSLVSSEGMYGDSCRTSFLRAAKAGNFCVAVVEVIPRLADEPTFDGLIESLLRQSRARVVALFTNADDSRALLAAAKRANVNNHFIWVASYAWGTRAKVVEGLDDQDLSAFTVQLDYKLIPEYNAHMKNLTVENNERNPWFREYWEKVFRCSVDPAQQIYTSAVCGNSLRLDESVGYHQEAKVQFVVDAVYAFAHALDEASKQLCRGQNESYCEALRNLDGESLYMNYLLNTTFKGVVRFDNVGDGLAPYRIYSLRHLDNSSTYDYIPIGRWEPYTLHMDAKKVLWSTDDAITGPIYIVEPYLGPKSHELQRDQELLDKTTVNGWNSRIHGVQVHAADAHAARKSRSGHSGCGALNGERGIQRLEAMLFALDRINRDPSLLNGISLGATILDTCSSGEHALKQALQFLDPPANVGIFKCADGSAPGIHNEKQKITGVIGGSYSEVSQKVASLLGLFHVPQISPASTASSLGDKTRYDLFARTVPPDTLQAHVMTDIVHYFNWTYVSLVTSEGVYGDSGMISFLRDARAGNFCVAIVEVVPRLADEATFDGIIQSLLRRPQARVVALFTHGEDSRALLAAAKKANASSNFVWLASDGWGTQSQIVESLHDQDINAITVELDSRAIPEYDVYMKNLTLENNERNPWFREYWEDVFKCSVNPVQHNDTSTACAASLRLDESTGYRQGAKIQFVVDAVYAFAYALDQASKQLCRGENESNCEAFRNLDGESLYMNYLLNTTFEDLVGSVVRFDQLGDGLVPYRIYNLRRLDNSTAYDYVPIGRWEPYTLHLDSEKVLWTTEDGLPPVSACSSDCSQAATAKLTPHHHKASLKSMTYGKACAELRTRYKSGHGSSNRRHSPPRINGSPILVNMNVLMIVCVLVHFIGLALAGVIHDFGYDDHGYYGYSDHDHYGYHKEVPGPSFLVKTVHHVSKLHHGGHLHGDAW